MEKKELWAAAADEDAEVWEGPFNSREEAERRAVALAEECYNDGDPTKLGWVGRAEYVDIPRYAAEALAGDDVLRVLDQIQEHIDNHGDVFGVFDDSIVELREAGAEAIHAAVPLLRGRLGG